MYDLTTRVKASTTYEFIPSLRQVADKFNIGKSTLSRWVRSGSPAKDRKPRQRKFQGLADILKVALRGDARTTIDELVSFVHRTDGTKVSRSTVHSELKRMKFSCKKTCQSWTCQTVNVDHPFFKVDPYVDNPISIDESGFYMNDRPDRGWAPVGRRIHRGTPGRRTRLSLLLAVDKEGIVAKQIVSGGVSSATFSAFVATLPHDRTILLDNCSIHKAGVVRDTIRYRNLTPVFIPPYSPWFNPIENVFSQAKCRFKKLRMTSDDFVTDIHSCLNGIVNIEGMFRSSADKRMSILLRRTEGG